MFIITILLNFTVKVQVEKAAIKASPDFFSNTVIVVSSGTKLNADTLIAGWYRVKYRAKTGYIHQSCVKRFSGISLSAIGKLVEKDEDAISLAAKGFEEDNSRTSKGYNFHALRYLERFRSSEKDLENFKKEGGL